MEYLFSEPEGEGKEGKTKRVFKKAMAENFPNMAKDIQLEIQEVEIFQAGKIKRNLHQDISELSENQRRRKALESSWKLLPKEGERADKIMQSFEQTQRKFGNYIHFQLNFILNIEIEPKSTRSTPM